MIFLFLTFRSLSSAALFVKEEEEDEGEEGEAGGFSSRKQQIAQVQKETWRKKESPLSIWMYCRTLSSLQDPDCELEGPFINGQQQKVKSGRNEWKAFHLMPSDTCNQAFLPSPRHESQSSGWGESDEKERKRLNCCLLLSSWIHSVISFRSHKQQN